MKGFCKEMSRRRSRIGEAGSVPQMSVEETEETRVDRGGAVGIVKDDEGGSMRTTPSSPNLGECEVPTRK